MKMKIFGIFLAVFILCMTQSARADLYNVNITTAGEAKFLTFIQGGVTFIEQWNDAADRVFYQYELGSDTHITERVFMEFELPDLQTNEIITEAIFNMYVQNSNGIPAYEKVSQEKIFHHWQKTVLFLAYGLPLLHTSYRF